MLEVTILAAVLVVYAIRNELQIRGMRKDILLVAKNPRPARNELMQKKQYKNLD